MKIKQTFHVSDMIEQLMMYSHMLEDGDGTDEELIEKSTKLCIILMASYPKEYFLPEEITFVSGYMGKIQKYMDKNRGYNEFQ